MGNLLVNGRDQKFVLYEQLGIQKLFSSEKYADYSEEVVDMMLNEAEKMAVDLIVPTYDKGDKEGCTFEDGKVTIPSCYHDVFKTFCEAGWLCAHQDVEVGGQNMPLVAYSACMEYFDAANFAFMMYPGLTMGAAGLIDKHGAEEQKNKYMYRMYTGEWAGTMCLTEPGAGTDVGALRTTAKRLPDGTFSISGTKIFISCGDQDLTDNIIHPVLARIEGDPPGTGGISIFIVPKYRVNDDGSLGEFNDVRTGNIEHKMGIKGSATCTLNFGDEGNCIGELLGSERAGMRIMFQMMNEARLEVGMQGLGHATAAYEKALNYAKERIQSPPVYEMKNPDAKAVTIIEHPDIRRSLLWMKSHVEGIRALNLFTAYSIDMSHVGETEEIRKKYKGYVEVLTPISKAYSSDKAMEICSLAIDVHGGYGYCSEYPVEQYMRDCKIACLYEGTNAVQALDLVGRKLAMNRGQNVMNLFGEMGATLKELSENEDLKQYAGYFGEAFKAMSGLTQQFATWGKSAGFMLPILNARPYLMVFGDMFLGWMLFQGAMVAEKKLAELYRAADVETIAQQRALARENNEVAFYQGKIASAKFFATTVLTTIKGRCKSIQIGERIPFEMLEESFSS